VRAGVACAALAAILFGLQAAAQDVTEEPQVELPPEAPKSSPIIEVPLPTEPPKPPPVPKTVEKPKPPTVEKPKAAPPVAVQKPKQSTPAAVPTVEAAPKPTAECVIKPVMSDDDLRACGARP
jgi:outer membrane biosynthesis protein TonB